MLKQLSAVTLFFLFISTGFAQLNESKYDKLFDLYVMGDYEKCIKKAERYTEKDNTKRDPDPYLYLSMSYFKVAQDPELSEYYPRAFKNALKHAYKLYRKDDETSLMEDHKEFFTTLKIRAVEEALYNYNLNDFRKASYYLKKIRKFDPDDHNVQLMLGVTQLKARDRRSGKENISVAMENLKKEYEAQKALEEATADLVPEALVEYTNYLLEKNMYGKAQDAIADARLLVSDNPEVKKLYEEIYQDG